MKLMPRVVLLGDDVRRDGTFVLDFFTAVEFHIFYRTQPYHDHLPHELQHPRLHRFAWAGLKRQLAQLVPDIIVSGADAFCLAHFPRFVFTWWLARTLKARWVPFVLENRPFETRYGRVTRTVARFLLKRMLRDAWFVMAGNQGAIDTARSLGVPGQKLERVLFSNWGVDMAHFRPHASKKADVPTVLFVGRLVAEKGLKEALLAVIQAARALQSPVRFWIVGDGSLRPVIEEYRKKKLPHVSIELLGILPNSDLPKLFCSAWLTVSPSKTTPHWAEQIGVVNFQSLACGTPVLSTRSGAIPEYLREGECGAVLVSEGSVEALSDVIVRFVGEAAFRAELERKARPYAITHFDAQKNVRHFEKLVLEKWAA